MKFPVVIKDLAEIDIVRGFEYFAKINPVLGDSFLIRLDEVVTRIADTPELYAELKDGIRKVQLKQFPYVLGYLFENDTIYVLGLLHGRRRPSEWKQRRSR